MKICANVISVGVHFGDGKVCQIFSPSGYRNVQNAKLLNYSSTLIFIFIKKIRCIARIMRNKFVKSFLKLAFLIVILYVSI